MKLLGKKRFRQREQKKEKTPEGMDKLFGGSLIALLVIGVLGAAFVISFMLGLQNQIFMIM